jgi:uncharacterized tellurite resistance protein B-like protein
MPSGLIARLRAIFEGDPGVRKVAGDPVLAAELLLLFRMMLADGAVREAEVGVYRRICADAFGIGEENIEAVTRYLQEFGYETSASQALALFRGLPLDRRRLLVRHMADIAKADRDLSGHEVRLLRRTVDFLDLDPREVLGRPQT